MDVIYPLSLIFRKLLDTIEVNYSFIGRDLLSPEKFTGDYDNLRIIWYQIIASYIYRSYLSVLVDIQSLTQYDIHKGVPLHMLGIIEYNSERYMEMLPYIVYLFNKEYKFQSSI